MSWVHPGDVKKVIGLVGKGLTFDSGGYNLKVGGMIEMMKFDMGGAGAVLGAAQALAGIRPEGVEVGACRPCFPACHLERSCLPSAVCGLLVACRCWMGSFWHQTQKAERRPSVASFAGMSAFSKPSGIRVILSHALVSFLGRAA